MIKKLRYLCTLLLIAVASTAWGAEELFYTLDGTQTGGNNGYATESDITQGDISWKIMGNTTMSPSRIGGKSLNNEVRTAYSTTAMGSAISKLVLSLGTGADVTINSLELIVASDADFTNILDRVTKTEVTLSGDNEFIPSNGSDWVSGAFYKLLFNLTITETSNKYVQFSALKFYRTPSADQVATPTFSPVAGTYAGSQEVTINTITEGATIYYTTDGTDPTTNSSVYGNAIKISENTTIKAFAAKDGFTNSSIASASYTIVKIEHAGTETDPYTVADARAAIDASIYISGVYATGVVSAIPTAFNSQYNNITFNFVDEEGSSEYLQAYRCEGDEAANVQVGDIVVVYGNLKKYNSTYEFDAACQLVSLKHPTVAVEAPTFNPVAGTYSNAQTVTISCETDDATIYYTINGTEPTSESTEYTSPIVVSTATTIKAIAVKGAEQSVVVSATYHICSAEAPYTVAQALAFKEYPANGIYVHGIVSTAPTQAPTDAGQLTYYISDNGEATDQLQVYKGKGLEQAAFTAQDDIQVGDIVTIYGNVKIYNSTMEFDTNNYLVSFERPDVPYVLPVPTFDPAAGEVEAGTTVKIVVPEDDENIDYVLYSFDNEKWEEYNEETVIKIEEETIIYARSVGVDGSLGDIATAKYTVKAVTPTQDVVIVEDDKTTFLFNTEGNEWGFPTTKTVDEGSFTANEKTIKVAGSENNGYSYNTTDKYLLIGKQGAYLTLPAFDFEVGKIEVIGRTGASGKVTQNIFVNVDGEDVAVSTETTGIIGTQSYIIDEDYRSAGNIFTLKVTNANNTQITQIVVYKVTGNEKEDPQLKFTPTTATARIGSAFTAPVLSYVENFDGVVNYKSSDENVATVNSETGAVTLVAPGETTITAESEATDNFTAGVASYILTVKEAIVVGDDKYEQVRDASTLAENDVIIFVNIGSATANGATVQFAQAMAGKGANLFNATDIVINEDNTVSVPSETSIITLVGEEGTWSFKLGEEYLAATGTNNQNYLGTSTIVEDASTATIEIADGEAKVIFKSANRNYLSHNYNSGNPRFSCYSQKQNGLQIYRKVTSSETMMGDVNGDEKVDVADVTALVNIIVNSAEPTDAQITAGDLDPDEGLTVNDVKALVEKILTDSNQ